MTVFIDQTGTPDAPFSDIYVICGQDGGLGEDAVPADPTVARVTYGQSNHTPTADRMNTLVHTEYASPLVITGLPSSGVLPDGSSIAGNGATFVDHSQTPSVIRVVYDTGQCNGSNIWVVDTSGNHIITPNPVILYHELSHAFHYATGTIAATSAQEEVNAEGDENVLRGELGLPLRDVNSHEGGCGVPGDGGSGCFLVSAAYGSEREQEINRLRRTRDLLLRRSALGRDFFNQLYREYYTFSPRIAVDMQRDPELRRLVRVTLVGPLLDFYQQVEQYCVWGWRDDGFADFLVPHLARARATLIAEGLTEADAHLLHGNLTLLAAGLFQWLDEADDAPTTPTPATVLGYLAAVLVARQGCLPLARWALFTPLADYWRILADALSAEDATTAHAETLVRAMARWLGDAPLRYTSGALDRPPLMADLEDLATGAFSAPDVRLAVGTRMLDRYGKEAGFDLRATLEELRYLPAQPTQREGNNGRNTWACGGQGGCRPPRRAR